MTRTLWKVAEEDGGESDHKEVRVLRKEHTEVMRTMREIMTLLRVISNSIGIKVQREDMK